MWHFAWNVSILETTDLVGDAPLMARTSLYLSHCITELGASPRYLTFSVCCHFHCRTAEPLMWGHKTLGDDRGGILGQTLSGSMKEDRHLFHIE